LAASEGRRAPLIRIESLTSTADLTEAVRLQKEIWGFEDIELLPVRLFVVATKVGGQVFGAYDGSRMIGFLLAIPGVKPSGGSYLHSHMMGVVHEYRNRGVGRMLKLRQRAEALERGIDVVEWTFDPLELKNAWFNIERLGAVVRRYVLNQYGTTTSHLHGGLPTDRCIAEWHLNSDRVQAVLNGNRLPSHVTERVEVPNNIAELRQSQPAQAREIQRRISDSLLDCFTRDLAVIGFERGPDSSAYLLGPWYSD
jgi:predicted GNAT superfamily acetyltransferase